MIIRVFQVTTHAGKERDFAEFFRDSAIPLMLSVEGLLAVLPGAPREATPRDFAFVMLWRDLEALKAFAGEDYDAPHIHPDEAELVAARRIAHYDLVATGAKGLSGEVLGLA